MMIHVRVRGKFTHEWKVLYEDARSWLPSIAACIQFKEEFDPCTLGKRRLKVNEFTSKLPIRH